MRKKHSTTAAKIRELLDARKTDTLERMATVLSQWKKGTPYTRTAAMACRAACHSLRPDIDESVSAYWRAQCLTRLDEMSDILNKEG